MVDQAPLHHELLASLTPGELADRLIRLQHLTGALARAATIEQVADAMVTTVLEDLDAVEAWVCLLDAEGTSFDVVRHTGAVAETVEAWRSFPRKADLPACDALDRREAVMWEPLGDGGRHYPVLEGVKMAHDAYVIAPMTADDIDVGVAVFGFPRPGAVGLADKAFVQAAADQAAQAIHRAQLLEHDRQAHEWQRLLADAGILLAEAGLDYERVLGKVARLAVPALADGCVVHLAGEEGLRPVAAVHADPKRRGQLEALVALEPVVPNAFLNDVVATRESIIFPVVGDELLESAIQDEEHRRGLEEFGLVSAIAVALQSPERVLGTLTLMTNDPSRRLGEEHLAVAEDLAARASLTMENARAHERVAVLADQLQEALNTRVVLEQAKGMLAERYGIDPEEAFRRLRSAARSSQRKLHEVAGDLVHGTGSPGDPDQP